MPQNVMSAAPAWFVCSFGVAVYVPQTPPRGGLGELEADLPAAGRQRATARSCWAGSNHKFMGSCSMIVRGQKWLQITTSQKIITQKALVAFYMTFNSSED